MRLAVGLLIFVEPNRLLNRDESVYGLVLQKGGFCGFSTNTTRAHCCVANSLTTSANVIHFALLELVQFKIFHDDKY